ncbi:MAG: hypothetical protein NT103_09920 [Campylobacterales bacterium]|nr:hypothetical protein [Campylobacterales bacterium]
MDINFLQTQSIPLDVKCQHDIESLAFAISSSEDGIWEYDIQANTTFVSK